MDIRNTRVYVTRCSGRRPEIEMTGQSLFESSGSTVASSRRRPGLPHPLRSISSFLAISRVNRPTVPLCWVALLLFGTRHIGQEAVSESRCRALSVSSSAQGTIVSTFHVDVRDVEGSSK